MVFLEFSISGQHSRQRERGQRVEGLETQTWRDDRRSLKPLYRVQGVAQGQLIGQETNFQDMYGELWG